MGQGEGKIQTDDFSKSVGLVTEAEIVFSECIETLKRKNADYSNNADSLKNFKVSAMVANVTTSQGILVRLMDKMTRIGNLINKEASVKDESIFDTIMDAINYCLILLVALKEEKNG